MYSYTFPNTWVTQRSITKYEKIKSELSNSTDELPASRFVMFNYPRSGSNLVCGMLDKHPEILSHHEVFNPKVIYYSHNFHTVQQSSSQETTQTIHAYKLGIVNRKIERDVDPEGFCFKLWKNHYGFKAVGFNVFPTHVPNMSVNLVRDRDLKKILLIRRNKLKCYVSRALARRTGVRDLYGNKEDPSNSSSSKSIPATQVKINPTDLLRWSKKYDEYFETMRRALAGQDFFELYYEDIVGPDRESIKLNLLKFIDVNPDTAYLTPPLKKQNSRPISDLVSNYSELKVALAGTELESFLK